jgi:hypothetical protein
MCVKEREREREREREGEREREYEITFISTLRIHTYKAAARTDGLLCMGADIL